ncbi:LysR family transcriptional regulator [Diaphorobacter sp. HDW4A]|uniref:LysR family transcriptional regulator n=1 Tax=Diaphorobacter sp. HDW4A TaxID=2714924 RepID=UPI00140994A1|nr:LysR family transcriptional regulator [Diaphorobacter sp. HDW4A]QIL83551.1 LysR family transcriptional regulator [Diaphorobacter sp. HDW4A]
METRYIHNFLKVVKLGSMSDAARELDLSPAAVAQQMRTLERELGVTLLVRHGRRVRPTAAGERLFEKGQALVQECDELRDWVASDADQGELRLGTLNTVLHSFLPDVLQGFLQQHPAVQVHVVVDNTPKLYTALAQDELDVAICLKPAFELPKTICWSPLREETLVLLCQPGDAHIAPLELLRKRALVRYDRSLAGGKLAQRYLDAQEIRAHACLELNSVIAVAMMVERGLGVGLVPDVGDTLLRGRELSRLEVPPLKGVPPLPPRELGLLWQRTTPRLRWAHSLMSCASRLVPS